MQYDIVIIGAGLTGAAAAIAFRDYPGTVAVIEARDINRVPQIPLRGIALSDGSRRILDHIGSWDYLSSKAHPVKEIRVSRKGAFGVTRIRAEDENLDMLGCVISAKDLLTGLHQTINQLPQLSIYSPAQVKAASNKGSYVALQLNHNLGKLPKTIQARLLVIASGGSSTLSEQLGFSFQHKSYRQTAVVTTIQSTSQEHTTAYERFTKDGLIAVLPYHSTQWIIGRIYRVEEADAAMQMSDGAFIAKLQDDLGGRIAKITGVEERISYPLHLSYADSVVKGRAVLLGDSAQTIHPVGGQGLNLALRDIAFLAEHLYPVADPGVPSVLERYSAQRYNDVRRVIYFTEFLARAYIGASERFAPWLGASFTLLDLTPALRRILVRKTLGLSPPWPRLASGLSIERYEN